MSSTTATVIPDNAARIDSWRRMGEDVSTAMTAQEALEAGGLANWNVRKVDLTAHENGQTIAVPNRFATVYTDPKTGQVRYLGVVGQTYTPIQNEEHVGLLDAVVGESGAHFETVGLLAGGKQTFITMKMPQHIAIGGVDAHDLYLVGVNSHDGSSKFNFIVTPVRVSCSNMVRAAIREAVSTFGVQHRRGANALVAEAREALSLTFTYADAFQAEAEKMIERTLSEKAFTKVAAQLFGLDSATTTRAKNTATEHVAGAVELFRTSPTLDKIKGTRWAGYNAITEYADHFMSVRSVNGRDVAEARAQRAVLGKPIIALKENAFAAFGKAVLAG